MTRKRKNNMYKGVAAVGVVGGIIYYLYQRFSVKIIRQNEKSKTVTVKVTDGFKTYTGEFSVLNETASIVMEKYKLSVNPMLRSNLLEVSLSSMETGAMLEVTNIPVNYELIG